MTYILQHVQHFWRLVFPESSSRWLHYFLLYVAFLNSKKLWLNLHISICGIAILLINLAYRHLSLYSSMQIINCWVFISIKEISDYRKMGEFYLNVFCFFRKLFWIRQHDRQIWLCFKLTWAESSSELFWSPVVRRLSDCPSVRLSVRL